MPNIEDHLRKAMAEGKFDNLPGKGKPLRLDDFNPHADPEWELAYKMLKDSGFSLPWIEVIREIERDIEAARQDLLRAWEWRQATPPNQGSASEFTPRGSYEREPSEAGGRVHQSDDFIFAEWERALAVFKDKLEKLNKRIRDYNLEVPNARFQRPVLNYEREVEKITGRK